jgi:hypothetical protein
LVTALAVSAPVGTLVVTVKLALAGFARPDVASEAVHARLTSVACHAPSAVPQDAVGPVASRLMVTDWLAEPPELVAVQVNVVPAVSLVTVVEPQPDCDVIAESGSVTLQPIVGLAMYQPLTRVPVTVGVITGGVTSVGVIARL